ncbi:MAG: RNA polymerase sigma factor [Pirellulales bacterium]|nr:RNA polymerase sigma factor [Pirellulales bacterium]
MRPEARWFRWTASVKPEEVQQAADLYFARIHRAALILCGNPWDADDLAQETFLVLARDGSGFAGRSSLYTWLYGVLLNLERRMRRSRTNRQKALRLLSEQAAGQQGSAAGPEACLEAAEWRNSLWALVEQLPDPQRVALVLRFAAELKYEEIAEVVGCPVGTVKSRIHHGLLGLRALAAKAAETQSGEPRGRPEAAGPARPAAGLAAQPEQGGISRVV